VNDLGDTAIVKPSSQQLGMRNFGPLIEQLTTLKAKLKSIHNAGNLPMMLGGEHTMSVASVSASLERFDGDLAVLWIDAHADLNIPGHSPSGNMHGMPLAALCGFESGAEGVEHDQWEQLVGLVGDHQLALERVGWIGLREVDHGERITLRDRDPGFVNTMYEFDLMGIASEMDRMDQWLRNSGAKYLHVSFDVDVMDPILAPGTGTAVRGGLTYREAQLCAELLREKLDAHDCPYRLASLDVVETNPIPDNHNETAVMAVEWVASLFGKTILGVAA
jgi:arginase